MDSQDSQLPLSHPHHPHHQTLHHSQAQFHHHQMLSPPQHHNSYAASIPSMMHHQHHQQQQSQQNPRFPFNSMPGPPSAGQAAALKSAPVDYSDASSPGAPCFSSIEPARKKRGRPRKYSPDGNIALGLSPTPVTPISSTGGQESGGPGTQTLSSENQGKKVRGRPPGSVKKQMDALGSAGIGFTPHVITVEPGEDVALKIMEFSQQGPRTVCILSAIGAICNVTLRQPSNGGGTLTLEGQFEIISLSGSFLFSESDGPHSRPSGLSVSLAGADGKVVGGAVAGTMKASSQVQMIVGSFIADGKKPKYKPASSTPPPPLLLPPPTTTTTASFSTPQAAAAVAAAEASQSEEATSASSDENGVGPASYGGGSQPPPIQSMPMYGNIGWPNSQMHHHHHHHHQ